MDLKAEVKAKAKDLEALNVLLVEYPDARTHRGRWETVYVTSQLSLDNPGLKWEFRRSCGCCIDSAYQFSVYLPFGNTRIYPEGWYRRTISFANEWSGDADFSEESVRSSLAKAGLPERLIESALFYLNAHAATDEEE